MADQLTWDEIKQRYKDEWVELIDFDWDETDPYPRCGVVRVHSKDRREFDKLISKGRVKESAILFAGKLLDFPEGSFFNANQQQYFPPK